MVDDIEEERESKSGIIREATALSTTLYIGQAIFMIRGFIIARVLSPAVYGVWVIFQSFFSSAPYLGLGTQQGMMREVPFNKGEGNKSIIPVITQTSLTWNIIITSVISLIAFILTFTPFISDYRFEVRLAGLVFILNAVYLFTRLKFKSEKKIILLSKFILANAVLNTVFGLTLLFFFEIKGLLTGMIISHLALTIAMVAKGNLSFHLSMDKKIFRRLVNIGLPIILISSVFFLIHNIDKYVIFLLLGKTMAGYYGLAAFISSIVNHISYSLSTVLFPRMMYKFGRTKDIKDLETYFNIPMTILAGIIPVILGIIYINIGEVIKIFLPQYIPSIPILYILIFGLFFSTIKSIPTNILIALNKQKIFMYIIFGLLIVDIIAVIFIVKSGFGITGVAVATTSVFVVSSLIATIYSLRYLKNRISQIFNSLAIIYLPFIYSFGSLMLIMIIDFSQNAFINNLLKSLLFLIFNTPVILYTEKKSKVAKKMFRAIKDYRK